MVAPRSESHSFRILGDVTHSLESSVSYIMKNSKCWGTSSAQCSLWLWHVPCILLAWGSLWTSLTVLRPHVIPVWGTVGLQHLPFLLHFGCWVELTREHRFARAPSARQCIYFRQENRSSNWTSSASSICVEVPKGLSEPQWTALSRGNFLKAKLQPEKTRSPIPGSAPPIGPDDFTNNCSGSRVAWSGGG